MNFLKSLFGSNPRKHEDKADELRLDLEFRDAAYYYRQALDATPADDEEATQRLRRKLAEVRRAAFADLMKEAAELASQGLPELAHEKLDIATNFAESEAQHAEVERRMEELAEQVGAQRKIPEPEPGPEEVVVGKDLFELAISGYEPEDRERAQALGDPFREAFDACQREDWDEAATRLAAVIEEHPDVAMLHELAGMVAEQRGLPEEALADYRRAHEIQPDRAGTVTGLATHLRKNGMAAEARQVLADAAERRPVTADLPEAWVPVHLEYALSLAEDGHHDAALAAGASLLEARSADAGMIYYNMAGVLEKAGREDDCRAALEAAIQAAPRMALYRERLADFLVKRRLDLDAALALLVGANEAETGGVGAMLGGGGARATVSPNRPRYLYKMARVYFLKGEDLEAERTITTALAVTREPEIVKALEELRRELKESPARQG